MSIKPASVNTIPITGGTAQIISATEFEAVEPNLIQTSTQNPAADSGLDAIEGFDRAAAIDLASDNKVQLPIARFSLEALTTIQHNKHENIKVSSHIDSSITNVLNVSINVSSTPLQVIDNKNFSRSLSNLADDLQQASDQEKMRHDVSTDALFGVSFSLTAAFIGWTLRGGALLGSMLALQPLWASADPIKAASKIRDNDSTKEDSKLEEIFD